MRLIHLHVEERTVWDKFVSSPLRKIYFTASFGQDVNVDSNAGKRSLALHAPILKFLTTLLDKQLAKWRPSMDSITSNSGSLSTSDLLSHLLLLLRRVTLKQLHAFTGWESSETDHVFVKRDLQLWMQKDHTSARECLWHAISIYNCLRTKQHFSCYDPYIYLVSTLYILAFDRLGPVFQGDTFPSTTTSDRITLAKI